MSRSCRALCVYGGMAREGLGPRPPNPITLEFFSHFTHFRPVYGTQSEWRRKYDFNNVTGKAIVSAENAGNPSGGRSSPTPRLPSR